jgi:hypothetical protein
MVNQKNCPYMSVLLMVIREGNTMRNRMNYHTKLCLLMHDKK